MRTCPSVINLRLIAMQKRIDKLARQMAMLKQKDRERRWYLMKLKEKHRERGHTYGNIYRKFNRYFKFSTHDLVKLRTILNKSDHFLHFINKGIRGKRYIRYFTINELAKMNQLLKFDFRFFGNNKKKGGDGLCQDTRLR